MALTTYVSGGILKAESLNSDFALVNGAASEALTAATEAAATLATVTSGIATVENQLTAATAQLTTAQTALASAETNATSEASSAAQALTITTQNAASIVSLETELASVQTTAATNATATQNLVNEIGSTIAPLNAQGVIPSGMLGLVAGPGVSISGSTISAAAAAAGVSGEPDVYLYFGGIASAQTGEYAFGIRASKGVYSVTHEGTGLYQIAFSKPFADSNWIGLYSGGYGGDNSGATPGDTSISDGTMVIISEHRGGQVISRNPSILLLNTIYIGQGIGATQADIARISVAIWAAPTS
jgi:hypothetical protein